MYTIHVVSHTHWDREWYLTFQQFRFRLVELMDQLLALLEADPDYRYFLLDGQAIVLEDYLDVRPEREEEICRYVQDGRLIIGPWYILPDEFLVSPEAMVRNLLMGERACRRFGREKMEIGYLPDPFGHVGQMPQILRGFGIDVACMWRGVGDQPTELRWRAPDGSQVLVLHLRDSYSNAAWLPADEDGFVQGLAELRDSLVPHATTSHVLAMQGTDHMRPRADLPGLLAAADVRLGDARVVHSTLPRYLAAVRDELGEREAQLPVVEGELRSPQRAHLLPAVLSTRMWIKQRNHACETLLERWAEPFSGFARHVDRQSMTPSTRQMIWRAWRYLLENHPHDSICGCSVDQVHREMATRFDWCEQIGEEVTRRALHTLAGRVDVSSPAVVVFNPTDSSTTDLVSAALRPPPEPGQSLLDEGGKPVPYRTLDRRRQEFFNMEVDREGFAFLAEQFKSTEGQIKEGSVIHHAALTVEGTTARVDLFLSPEESAEPIPTDDIQGRIQELLVDASIQRYSIRILEEEEVEIQFVARDVPAVGYTTYTLATGSRMQGAEGRNQGTGDNQSPTSNTQYPVSSIENEFLRVEADLDDGTLTIVDKATGRILPGCNHFVDGGDRGDEYTYCRPEHDRLIDRPAGLPNVRLLSSDEVGATLKVASDYQVPASLAAGDRSRRAGEMVSLSIVTRVTLKPGVRRVDLETTVENQARDHRLCVHFPTGLAVDTARADAHFDVVERPLDLPTETDGWVEQPVPNHPQRAFVDVSDGEQGVILANRGLPEYAVLRGENGADIVLTLLRCVGWLSRGDMHNRQGHAGPEEATPEAQCLGRYTFHYSLIPHAGDFYRACALARAFQAGLRAVPIAARPGLSDSSGVGGLPARLSFVTVEPATLVVSAIKEPGEGEGLVVRCCNMSSEPVEGVIRLWRPFERALLVNLAENSAEGGAAELARDAGDANAVTLPIRGWEIVTLKFEFAIR